MIITTQRTTNSLVHFFSDKVQWPHTNGKNIKSHVHCLLCNTYILCGWPNTQCELRAASCARSSQDSHSIERWGCQSERCHALNWTTKMKNIEEKTISIALSIQRRKTMESNRVEKKWAEFETVRSRGKSNERESFKIMQHTT